jgi:hypothetical protein
MGDERFWLKDPIPDNNIRTETDPSMAYAIDNQPLLTSESRVVEPFTSLSPVSSS